VASQNFASTAFNAREKCTVPCGGVGLMPREKVPPYELKTSCSACTACNPFSSGSGSAPLIEEKQACETVGCCEWDSDKEKCNAAKTGLCNASHVDTVLSIQSGIACKNLPALGVSPWTANAVDAGFELRECGNPTDVCASYCVAIHSVRRDTQREIEREGGRGGGWVGGGGSGGGRERESQREFIRDCGTLCTLCRCMWCAEYRWSMVF
jgi:hypothetical protein